MFDELSKLEKSNADARQKNAVAIIDLGSSSSALIIGAPSLVWFRSIPVNGDSFTETLLRSFQLTYAQAKLISANRSVRTRLHRMYGQLEPVVRDLIRSLQRSA